MVENFIVPEDCKDGQVIEIAEKLLTFIIRNPGKLITYGDLSKQLSFPMNPRNIEQPLGRISFACIENGLPPVSVMVVNKDTSMPGMGFFKAYCPEIKSEDEQMKLCFEYMDRVNKYEHWDDVLSSFTGNR